jgi:hypothetical protein
MVTVLSRRALAEYEDDIFWNEDDIIIIIINNNNNNKFVAKGTASKAPLWVIF